MKVSFAIAACLVPHLAIGAPKPTTNVLVGYGQELYPTLAAARAHLQDAASKGDPIALW